MIPDPDSAPAISPRSPGPAGESKPSHRLSFITILFASAALLLVATLIFDHRIALIRNHAQQQMATDLLVLQQLGDFISALKDTETGQRGYLLTGDDAYLQPFTNVRAQVQSRLDELKRLAASGELPADKVDRVATLTQEKLSELEQTIQLRREKGLDAALNVVASDRGKQLMDQLRSEMSAMRTGEEKDFAEAARQSDRAAALRTGTFVALIIVNLGFLAWAFRKIGREVSRREAAALEVAGQKELLSATLTSIGDAVVATDSDGRVSFLNPEAESLTGWKSSEAVNRPLSEIFNIVNEQTRRPVENPVDKVLRMGTVVGLANHTVLLARNGREIPIDDSAAPIREPNGPLRGVVLVFRDVTQVREAQKATAHLASIVEFSGDVILTKNLDGIIQSWNASAQRLFGYRADEIIGKHVTKLFPQDRLSEEDHIVGRLREGRPVERFETIRVAKDGRQIPVSVSVSPLKDPEGNIIGASKVVHDITELVAAREALVREKELLSTTLASIGDAVIVTDSQGAITFLNSEAEHLTGWQSSQAAGRPLPEVFRIINEETRQSVENPVDKVLRLGTVVGLANHTVLLARDGREIPIDDSAAPIRREGGPLDGVVLVFRDFTERKKLEAELKTLALLPQQNPAPIMRISGEGVLLFANPVASGTFEQNGLVPGKPAPEPLRSFAAEALKLNEPLQRELPMRGRTYLFTVAPAAGFSYANFYGTDVTARKQAEDALRAREMELETIINRTPFMLTRCTRDLHYAFVSQAYAQMLGRNPSDIIGKPIAQIMGDEGFKTILPHVNKVLEGVAVHYEEAVHFQGVGQRSLEVTYKPERNENGHVTGWIASILDVSSRKEAERALSTAHTQLADRAVHLEKLVAERTAKLREMVGELQHVSYAIVHDMRAPLRAMSAFADALLTDLSVSSGASELLDYCRRIIAGSARLDKLIQDSLNYTKAVLQEVPLKPVDLNPLIKSLLDTYPNLQPDKADITIDGKLPVVLGDESLLTQCFSNLLGNAVKFVPRGVRPQIQVRAESSSANGLTRVTVQDNGIGFAANAQARLFGMFQRFTNDYEGTGIGLAIVRKVTERMGGRVGADSEPGKGSRFWVELRTPNSADHSQPNSST